MLKKKILIFSLAYLPYIGGAELALKEITERIDEFDFHLITSKGLRMYPRLVNLHKREHIGRIEVFRIGSGQWWDQYFYPFRAVKLALKLQQQYNYSLVWAILESQAGLAASQFKKIVPSLPYVLNLQSGDSESFWFWRTFWWSKKYRQVFQEADYIHAISSSLARKARQQGSRCPIEIIPNGVNFEKFSTPRPAAEIERLRDSLNISSAERIVISVSRLVEKNGIDILIKAIKLLKNQSLVCIIVGTGPQANSLKKLVRNLDLQRNIIFVGQIAHQQLPKYLQLSDIFVRPARSEGLGNAFLEAMAAGLPIIGTSVGGITDFLKDKQTGLVAAVNNPPDLAQKISTLLTDLNLVKQLSQAGQSLVKEKYDWQIIALRIKKIFQQLIE